MEEATTLFRQIFKETNSIEISISELKRKGFSQLETVKALMEVSALSLVESDELVLNSLAWSD